MRKRYLAMAVASVVVAGGSTAQAVDFGVSTTLQNTLAVTVVQDLDVGTVFATATGAAATDGVGALQISPAGAVADISTSAVSLTSLTAPTAAQGSVAMTADFTLTLPATNTVAEADFDDGTGASLGNIATVGAELVHESANPAVPSLWLMHYTVAAVSGGTVTAEATTYDGSFAITQDFGETAFVFNIGATLTTEPGSGSAETYQEGLYSGTFEVTAAY